MTSTRKRPLENVDNSAAPPQKKQKKLDLKRAWTRTNPETGKDKGGKARLYRKATIQLKQHRQRRSDEKKKKKSTQTTSKKVKKKVKKKTKSDEDEEDYSRYTRRYEGHVVVITGGGEAIGQAIAVRMAQEGAYVYLLDHYKFNDTIDLCEQYGRPPEDDESQYDDYQGFKCDVSDIEQVKKCVDTIIKERGYIDVLINAAFAHKGDGKILEECKPKEVKEVMNTNFNGTFNTCKVILPLMAKVNYGRVVNIVSYAGKRPGVGTFIEASASAAVIAGTKCMADDYARVNITANVVTASYFEHDSWKLDKQDVKQYIPIGRNGELAEIAGVAAFVASEENGFSTGTVYDCSGGVNIPSN